MPHRTDYDNLTLLSSFTVAEFRSFRKALAVLMRAGLGMNTATDILLESTAERRQTQMQARDFRRARVEA